MSPAGRHRLARRGLLSAVVGVSACVVVAASVLAFASRSTHLVAVLTAPQTSVSSTATCPAGQHVLFGGFDVSMRETTGFATGMRRTASDAWTVDADNLGRIVGDEGFEPSPIGVSSFVYCGFGAVPSKATSTVELRYPRRSFGSTTAQFPAGTVVVARGFASTPESTVAVTELERVVSDPGACRGTSPFYPHMTDTLWSHSPLSPTADPARLRNSCRRRSTP